MTLKLSTNARTLREILRSYRFVVPRFQRAYSWTADNVQELWDDVVKDSDPDGDYFIGSMVVYETSRNTEQRAVIDGQQRLTTLLMLLSALRNAAETYSLDGLANGIHAYIERPNDDDQLDYVFRTETGFPYLEDQVFSRGATALQHANPGLEVRTIEAAAKRLSLNVDGLIHAVLVDSSIADDDKLEVIKVRLEQVRDQILNLKLIFIDVGDRDAATTIFVTLNARGLDLEPSALVRAHLLNLLPAKGAFMARCMLGRRSSVSSMRPMSKFR